MNKKGYLPYREGEKIRVAVMFQVASYWPSIESFYQACMQDDEMEIRIFFIDDLSVETAQIKDTPYFLDKNNIPYEVYSEERIAVFCPHVALYQPPYDAAYRNVSALSIHLRKKGIRIMYIPYGIEIADTQDARLAHFNTYVIRNSWRIYTFSQMMMQDYQEYCPNRHAVRVTGTPKFDAICNNDSKLEEKICTQAAGRKIVVWKMHFPKQIYDGIRRLQVTPYLSEYLKFARQIPRWNDLFFVVMPHPMFFSATIQEELAKQAMELFEILRTQENAEIDLSSDYRNSFYHADAIIVDRSALMVEAGLCGVPVLYMRNKDYEEPLTKAVKCLVDTYEQGTDAEDMVLFLENFKKDGFGNFMQKRNAIIQENMPFLDGCCGKRIAEDVKSGIKKENDDRIKVVFFGAGNVCLHYINRLGILHHEEFDVVALADNSSGKWGTVHAGMKVIPPEKLKEIDFDILVITTEQYHMPIKQKLVYELFLDEDKILRLDVFCEKYFSDDGV